MEEEESIPKEEGNDRYVKKVTHEKSARAQQQTLFFSSSYQQTLCHSSEPLFLPIHFQSHSVRTPSISFDRSLTQIQWPCHHIPHVFLDSSSACISRITTLKMFQALTEDCYSGLGDAGWIVDLTRNQTDGRIRFEKLEVEEPSIQIQISD